MATLVQPRKLRADERTQHRRTGDCRDPERRSAEVAPGGHLEHQKRGARRTYHGEGQVRLPLHQRVEKRDSTGGRHRGGDEDGRRGRVSEGQRGWLGEVMTIGERESAVFEREREREAEEDRPDSLGSERVFRIHGVRG